MVRFSLAAKYPLTENLELTWKCGVFTLRSQNKMIFHKSSTTNTQIFWKPVTAFHLLHLHFYFSQSWNTFSCYYLSLKVLPPKISKLGLLSNFHRTYRKKASKYQAEILYPGFRAFHLSFWFFSFLSTAFKHKWQMNY